MTTDQQPGALRRAYAYCVKHRLPARGFALGLLVVGVILAFRLWPHHFALSSHPSLMDRIFQSRALIFAIRLTVVFAAAFIVASLFANIWSSQWLSKAGPFEVSESVVADLKDEVRRLEDEAGDAALEVASLKARLDASNKSVDELTAMLSAPAPKQIAEPTPLDLKDGQEPSE